MKHLVYILFIALATAFAGPVYADIVYLKDGRKLEGEVTEKDGQVLLKMRYGSIYLKSSQILRVERKETDRQKLVKAREKLGPKDVDGRIKLAVKFYKRKDTVQARELLREVWKIEPGHKEAVELYKKWFSAKYRRYLHRKVLSMEIPFQFRQAPWRRVLSYLKRTSGLTFHLPSSVKKKILGKKVKLSYSHPGLSLHRALDDICTAFGIGWDIRDGDIHFTSKPPRLSENKFRHHLRQKKLTLRLKTTLGRFVYFLKTKAGLKVTVDGEVSKDLKVELEVENLSAAVVLQKVLSPHGLDYVLLGDQIYISTKAKCRQMKERK